MIRIECNGFQRVSKAKAANMFYSKKTIYIVSCKMRPDNMWAPAVPVPYDVDFSTFCNHYAYYNCNHETGYYPAFYIKAGNK